MISEFIRSPQAAERMRTGCVGPYIDGFAASVAAAGHTAHTIRGYIGTVTHLGRWADQNGVAVKDFDEDLCDRFRQHLSQCRCTGQSKGVFHHASANVRHFLKYLRSCGVVASLPTAARKEVHPPVSARFGSWMLRHRGVTERTVGRYQRALLPFFRELGEYPATYDVAGIRRFVVAHLSRRGREEARTVVTAVRAFLRFLVAEGRVPSGIEHCVPAVPQWRLSSLPRFLEPDDLERVVRSCDLAKSHGLRDHAILLLLARLGLRAADIVFMSVGDLDWERGTVRVRGKSRREELLPLPQSVGDAILAYIERGRRQSTSDRLFLCMNAPTRPLGTSASVSDIVRFALKRAGIAKPPNHGAHLLRHSAATAMLRSGGSLDAIAAVLRHKSRETTAHYAKVDVVMLQQVTQPWPGGVTC